MVTTAGRRAVVRLAALLAGLALAAPAAAGPPKVVVALTGARATQLARDVATVLEFEGYEIVGRSVWDEAIGDGRDADARAAAATRVGAVAVVIGRVEPRGRRQRLSLVVYRGATGTVVETITVTVRGARLDAARLSEELVPAVDRAREAALGGRRRTSQPAGAGSPPPVDAGDAHAEGGAADVAARAPAPSRPRPPLLTLTAGASLGARQLRVSPAGSADAYQGRASPGLRVSAELYPAAGAHSFVRDLGLAVLFDGQWAHTMVGASGVRLTTTQQRYGVDLRWRWRVASGAMSPVVVAAFGYQHLGYSLGDRSLVSGLNLADAAYDAVGPTLALELPLGTPVLHAGAALTYLALLGTGGATNAPSGTTWASAWGIECGAHVDYLPWRWLLLRVELDVTRVASTFKPGVGATTTSGTDTYFGGAISVGYVY